MSFRTASCVAAFVLWTGSGPARGEDRPAAQLGKEAAHAALLDGADVPASAPQLPTLASEQASNVLAGTAFGKKGEVTRRAHVHAKKHAHDDAVQARADAANRAAQGAIAAAARAANADAHVAAGQARANAAKATAASHKPPSPGAP